jgi:hypothetical protein
MLDIMAVGIYFLLPDPVGDLTDTLFAFDLHVVRYLLRVKFKTSLYAFSYFSMLLFIFPLPSCAERRSPLH